MKDFERLAEKIESEHRVVKGLAKELNIDEVFLRNAPAFGWGFFLPLS
jgi:hypothetical protein